MKWKKPPLIKIYEALGALADERVLVEGTTAKVWSSRRDKYYEVVYDPIENTISSNDNGSYWQGYVGYPSIALLAALGIVEYRPDVAEWLKGIRWKDINTRLKNDYAKVQVAVHEQLLHLDGYDQASLEEQVLLIAHRVSALELNRPRQRAKEPPATSGQ